MISPSVPLACGRRRGNSGGSLYLSRNGSFLPSAEAQALDSNYEGMRLRVESGEHSNLWGQAAFLAGALGLAAGEGRPAGISSHEQSTLSKTAKMKP
jgi:hypothetical protein